MGKVMGGMVMSLDGYINDDEGSVARLYPDLAGLVATPELQEMMRTTGAVVMGRRSYEMAEGDFTGYEFQTPIFVVTHHIPTQVARGENERLRFHFVTDGIASAVAQAKAAAGNQNVEVIGGASTIQQALQAGVLDELSMYIMPVLLGGGTRLFDGPIPASLELETTRQIESPKMIYLRLRVIK
ncbi:MAG: dihydrofolate reductase family protein [Anaerolineae bacterium]|nr:dihydrofolate reductase family protein [Anaerolineae bacterium]